MRCEKSLRKGNNIVATTKKEIRMITLLFFNKFPEDWESSTIWFIAAMEGFADAFALGILARMIGL